MNLTKPLIVAALVAVSSLSFAQTGSTAAAPKAHPAPAHAASKPMHDKQAAHKAAGKHEAKAGHAPKAQHAASAAAK